MRSMVDRVFDVMRHRYSGWWSGPNGRVSTPVKLAAERVAWAEALAAYKTDEVERALRLIERRLVFRHSVPRADQFAELLAVLYPGVPQRASIGPRGELAMSRERLS